ncbi:leucine-rich repeat neuronal protein 1-like [Hyposmocoma kahamanoa]|uniref:leucine-rich repeat neuronal protein 1-like n=1 Tax=Hyposmocoma kahamanoa TaxID=1477025 RepID=UPI000E6D8FD1|nr:leucine-rich repeat neuronal protein 1-like [Hyposmocoma kahamanoa]XP_026322618.1 leucine-rich repeat neuronal protein 1-like [Hyposmocoma kahamanoa]
MDGRVVGFVLTLFLVGLNADDDQLKVVKAVEICRFCKCTDGAVDCQYQNITTFFKKEQWDLLKDLKPTNVDLSDNFFTNITGIAELPIEVLNLSRSRVEWIENGSFKNLKQLRILDLSHNRLTAAKLGPHAFEGNYSPEEYEPLPSMRVLNLAYNDLHSLNSDLFEHLPELTELDLSGNPLGIIDHVTVIAISSLPMLKVLRMRSCEIKDIPDKMLHTPRYLERLDLSDNLLTTVPQELQETKNLLFLNLNQNPIKELDVTSEDNPGFPRLRKLQELHMCNMAQLRRIGAGSLSGLESLSKLHLSLNPRLTEIDAKALARADDIGETYVWPPIKELYLHSNNLSEIDSNLIARWDLVDAIDVSNNPFMCDCTTQWMVDILVPIVEGTKANSSAMVCHEPIEMRPFTMKHLHDIHRTMRCVDKYGHRPERDGAILMGTLIGVLLSVPIMLSLMLLWRRGYFACIGIRGPVDVSRAFYKRAPGDDNFVYNNN